MTDDIVAFIKQRLDEDARAIETIRDGGYAPAVWRIREGSEEIDEDGLPWVEVYGIVRTGDMPPGSERDEGDVVGRIYNGRQQARHIVLHDPAREYRAVEAKRRIVDWCVEVIGDRDLSGYGQLGSLKDDPQALAVTLAVETLRNLASEHDTHPDYRKEDWTA